MSTPNFHMMDNFNLFVKVYEPMSLEDYKENEFHYDDYCYPEYEATNDDEWKEELLEKSYNHAMELWSEDFYRDTFEGYDGFKGLMEKFNDTLIFHEITFKSGYYDGVQLFVEEKEENPHELDNEDCRYCYDMCRSQAIRKYDAEIRKINRWMEKVATQYGWRELHCLGIFSNGEAIYEYAH